MFDSAAKVVETANTTTTTRPGHRVEQLCMTDRGDRCWKRKGAAYDAFSNLPIQRPRIELGSSPRLRRSVLVNQDDDGAPRGQGQERNMEARAPRMDEHRNTPLLRAAAHSRYRIAHSRITVPRPVHGISAPLSADFVCPFTSTRGEEFHPRCCHATLFEIPLAEPNEQVPPCSFPSCDRERRIVSCCFPMIEIVSLCSPLTA